MALKLPKGSSSKPRESRNRNKFVNEKAEAKYNDFVENRKSLIMERGLRPSETLNCDGGIAKFIISRGSETLIVVPMTTVVPVVWEFYANAFFEQDDDLVIV